MDHVQFAILISHVHVFVKSHVSLTSVAHVVKTIHVFVKYASFINKIQLGCKCTASHVHEKNTHVEVSHDDEYL
jgi:hypothetical protein